VEEFRKCAEDAKMAQETHIQTKQMRAMSIKLTDEQKKAIQAFWHETGTVGTVGLEVDVVGDRISPASIQVGTAK
jgi:hypothetical protein